MFSVNKISLHFTGTYILKDISFIINPRDRIGLVGKNGAGKSTLLKILAKEIEAESGEVIKPSEATIGYLPQELEVNSNKSVYQEALTAFAEVLAIKAQIEGINEKIAVYEDYSDDDYLQLLDRLNDLTEKFNILGGTNIEANTERVLLGLGFIREELHNLMQTFSYGWQMRVELAKLLLKRPTLLLLDEPTNHLDIEAIQWLEDFLINYPGAVILVSHDRALLDNVTNRTIEVSNARVFSYKASYSEYVNKREDRIEQQTAAFNNQQREIKQIERFVERFRYKSTKSAQVQSRIKMLDKIDRVEIEDMDNSSIHFHFPEAQAPGKIVVEAKAVSKSYGSKLVLDQVDFTAIQGEKLAFVGKNGEGKSTFSKMIIGQLEHEGDLKLGHNVSLGYYAQNQAEMLKPELSVFDTIDEIAVGDIRPKIRGILGSFLFGEEDIVKKVKVLSGGEKARLSLAKLLLTPVNLIILDEPTNHLDMQSKDVLKSALLQYKGTLIIVSHDRDFLEGLTTKVYEFRDHKMKEYFGDIYEFLRQRNIRLQAEAKNGSKNKTSFGQEDKSLNKIKWEEKKQKEKEIRKLEKMIGQSESRIENIESKIAELDDKLSKPSDNQDEIASGGIYKNYNILKAELENEMKSWEQLHENLDKIQ
jgi:ATP-binding cassette, subfamily F, member 3